ncbi:MAG: hypothetical protein QW238_06775 [Candidatus Bathyarchaeia archaeon]
MAMKGNRREVGLLISLMKPDGAVGMLEGAELGGMGAPKSIESSLDSAWSQLSFKADELSPAASFDFQP